MDRATKNSIFSGLELDKLNDFCKQCAEEDRKIHKEGYVPPPEPPSEPKKTNPINSQPKQYIPPQTSNPIHKQENANKPKEHKSNSEFEKVNILKQNDQDPLNARIKTDTFNQRLAQFGKK